MVTSAQAALSKKTFIIVYLCKFYSQVLRFNSHVGLNEMCLGVELIVNVVLTVQVYRGKLS